MKRTPIDRKCPLCKTNKLHCFCDQVFKVNNKVRVTILMHHREKHLTTNTANLAIRVLNQSKIIERGLKDQPFIFSDLDINENEKVFFLFPHENAITIDRDFFNQNAQAKIHLIVPDGSWRQAKKVYGREESLQHIPCVKLPDGIRSQYQLRKGPREDGVCTYEAIAYALKVLEGENIFEDMMKIFKTMVHTFVSARYSALEKPE